MHWLLRTSPRKIVLALRRHVLPNLAFLKESEVRRCKCCRRLSLFLHFSKSEEFCFCIRCRATLRYEMIADILRADDISVLSVLELDRSSPLRYLLTGARTYKRTFFDSTLASGTLGKDGAEMQDITKLTFPDQSFDLIVSSEVLEHVPDLDRAFSEMRRVLKPKGRHIFTVPPAQETRCLAIIRDGKIVQLVQPPEYHGDPLGDGRGILAFWHLGTDFPKKINTAGLSVKVLLGPMGHDRRIVWCAEKLS